METKIGVVESTGLSANGQEGQYRENNTNILFDFIIHKKNVYVIPGDSVKVMVKTPSGRVVSTGTVIEINGREL